MLFFLSFFFFQAIDENTGSTIQRTLLSTRRIPSTRHLSTKAFINVVRSGNCVKNAYTDVPATWENANPTLMYASFQNKYCERLSGALRGLNVGAPNIKTSDYTVRLLTNVNRPGITCGWRKFNPWTDGMGELVYNKKSNNNPCSNKDACICLQPCEPGFFGSVDSVDCLACHPGRYSAQLHAFHQDDPSLACEACGVGQYQFDTPSACEDCPAGWYNDQKSQAECVSVKCDLFAIDWILLGFVGVY